jgi:predicted RNA binding protein YcfA (HicA-like mRNA interferase family)
MKELRYKDLVKLLEAAGAVKIREGKGSHQIWKRGNLTASVPNHRVVSPGTLRDIFKMLQIKY